VRPPAPDIFAANMARMPHRRDAQSSKDAQNGIS
jgi:hypothetical protein